MGEWKKSGCILCGLNCGLELLIENDHIEKVRPDKDNPRSKGYSCRKGLKVAYYEHNADRLTHPLKRVNGKHVRITWEQAISEIAAKAKAIHAEHGGRAFAYMGIGALGGHFEAAYGLRLLRSLGSQYFYNALAQEFSNSFWVEGRLTGSQTVLSQPDPHNAETLIAWGWNGWLSHQEARARVMFQEIGKDPNRMLVVIDPRLSETAERADLHLAIRPGADSTLLKAMINIIISEGWENKEWMAAHVSGWETVKPWFENYDARRNIEEVCQLNYGQVRELCRRIVTTRTAIHQDLGIYMNRHSTINNYMIHILRILGGNYGRPGTQIYPAALMPMGSHSDERDPKTWRTMATNMFPICGVFPPSAFPEEILSDHPQRLRAAFISATNPLRAYPDTKAYEAAIAALDLSVCIEVAYTETARLCEYVLPSRSYYESWDATFFGFGWPELYFQLRRPIVAPPSGECREKCEIFLDLARAMGFIPECPPELYAAAEKGISAYASALIKFLAGAPKLISLLPFVVGETLGKALGSVNKSTLFTILMGQLNRPQFRAGVKAAGFTDDEKLPETLYNAIIDNPQGLILARLQGDNLDQLRTEDKKIALHIAELETPIANVSLEKELTALEMRPEYPMILHAGLHVETNANSVMRNPEWNKKLRWGTMLVSLADAKRLNLQDGAMARVTTRASSVEIEVEVSSRAAVGCVYIPHGFGLIYNGKKYGVNVNELVLTTDRDELFTPLHRRIPCRVEAAATV